MATLSKEDRIQISKKVLDITLEDKIADGLIDQFDVEFVKNKKKDDANKNLMNTYTPLINGYQDELKYLDGNVRTELVEQDLIDSAKKEEENSFYPTDPLINYPSLPDNIWAFFPPFSQTKAIGKDFDEQYPSTIRTEQEIIDDIQAAITSLEGEITSHRLTGLICEIAEGFCSDNQYTDQASCELAGETWTPPGFGADTYSPHPTVVPTMTNLIAYVNEWKTILNNEKAAVVTFDEDATRQGQNDAQIADIDISIPIIDTWLAYDTFDTTTSLPSGSGGSACDDFNDMDENEFEDVKMTAAIVAPLKAELLARETFIATRQTQLETNLGGVTQDYVTNGEIQATEGFYGQRMLAIDSRLNLMKGTLNALQNVDRAKDAQNQSKKSNANTASLYSTVMHVSRAVAPGLDTNFINIEDSSGFSVGDVVYIMANDQQELQGSVVNVYERRLELSFKVPKKYTTLNQTRVYKCL